MPIRRAACICLVLALVSGGTAMAEEAATYDLYIAGIWAGEVRVSSSRDGDRYAAASQITPKGMVSAVARFAFEGEATGRIDADGRLEPIRFLAESRSPRSDRTTLIEFEDGVPVRVSVEPPRSRQPDPASQAGTIDPVSAGYAILSDGTPETICGTTLDLFDGSRRSRLVIDAAAPGDDGYVCAGTYSRIEGEAHSASGDRDFPFRLVLKADGDGLHRVERIETRTRFGRAVVERRS